MFDLIQQHIRIVLRANDKYDQAVEVAVKDLEAKGYRIVTGGQIDIDVWEITDKRTGETLAQGRGIDSYEAAYAQSAKDGRPWAHHDAISEDIPLSPPYTEGLPRSLCDALTEWVDGPADWEEIALVAGLDPDNPDY
jgi:hypothetical protein